MTRSPVTESSAPVGSSASSRARSPTIARAMATRCCWPPDRSSGKRSSGPSMATAAQRLGRLLAGRACGHAVDLEREHHVLDRGERRDQVEPLEDEADALPAQRGHAGRVEGVDVDARRR